MLPSVQNVLSSRLLSKNIKIKAYKTIIFTVVLYGCNITMGGGRKLQNEQLRNLYSTPNINKMIKSRRMRLAGHVV
jgi:hypothetical protein